MIVSYFAWVREGVGVDRETVEPPVHIVTIADLIAWLRGRSAGHAAALADLARLRAARDDVMAPLDAPIAGAREIALFPPVTGG